MWRGVLGDLLVKAAASIIVTTFHKGLAIGVVAMANHSHA
jgi:hypothetical protein